FPVFLYFLLLCVLENVSVQQSPSQLTKEGTEELTITCSHDDISYSTMLWYQHKQSSQSMSLIGFGVNTGSPNYEGRFEERFKLTRENTLKGALIIHKVNLSDSAVYFCAASTQ
uniref:Ig-like domain-containing protein n=1 Tax=Myripristis murdjan TaxID=586833 RepID=A0A667YGF2_9TELE